MFLRWLLLCAAFLNASVGPLACTKPAKTKRTAPMYVGGIQVNEPILDRWITSVEQAGLNTVSTTVYAKQADWDSARLWSDAKLAPVRAEIKAAKQAGLQVVLILRVALDHAFERNRFLWHGMISPKTDEQVDAWFDAYTAFVLPWARLAQEEGVDVLGIGSELNRLTATRPVTALPPLEDWYLDAQKQAAFRTRILSFGDRITARHRAALGGGHLPDNDTFLRARSEVWRAWAEQVSYFGQPDRLAQINRRRAHHERRWRQLIGEVRRAYRGHLTYAANFDHFQQVTFWDALDLIGINAYFELRPTMSTDDLSPQLLNSWRRVFDDIEAFQRRANLDARVLFTEIGYTWRRHSTLKPWAQSGFTLIGDDLLIWEDQPEAPSERAAALQALYRVARCERDRLAGLLYWKLSSWPDQHDVEPFVVILNHGDPAQNVLRQFIRPDCQLTRTQDRGSSKYSPAR